MNNNHVMPVGISEEMMAFARPEKGQLWHWASNLNKMLKFVYCKKCGFIPDDCEQYGCGAKQKEGTNE